MFFVEKYSPLTEREKKQVEFEKLEQGNLKVDEYLAKFLHLV